MNSFRTQRLRHHALLMSTAWLFNDIAEAKGKQELFTRTSNRIEGVTVAPDRLVRSFWATPSRATAPRGSAGLPPRVERNSHTS